MKEFSSRLAEEKEQKKLWKIQAEIRKLIKEEEERQANEHARESLEKEKATKSMSETEARLREMFSKTGDAASVLETKATQLEDLRSEIDKTRHVSAKATKCMDEEAIRREATWKKLSEDADKHMNDAACYAEEIRNREHAVEQLSRETTTRMAEYDKMARQGVEMVDTMWKKYIEGVEEERWKKHFQEVERAKETERLLTNRAETVLKSIEAGAEQCGRVMTEKQHKQHHLLTQSEKMTKRAIKGIVDKLSTRWKQYIDTVEKQRRNREAEETKHSKERELNLVGQTHTVMKTIETKADNCDRKIADVQRKQLERLVEFECFTKKGTDGIIETLDTRWKNYINSVEDERKSRNVEERKLAKEKERILSDQADAIFKTIHANAERCEMAITERQNKQRDALMQSLKDSMSKFDMLLAMTHEREKKEEKESQLRHAEEQHECMQIDRKWQHLTTMIDNEFATAKKRFKENDDGYMECMQRVQKCEVSMKHMMDRFKNGEDDMYWVCMERLQECERSMKDINHIMRTLQAGEEARRKAEEEQTEEKQRKQAEKERKVVEKRKTELILSEKELEEVFPRGSPSLCCFATYRKEPMFKEEVLLYVRELSVQFSRVVIMTNDDHPVHTDPPSSVVYTRHRTGNNEQQTSLDCKQKQQKVPGNCVVCVVPNLCLDFGLHWRVLMALIEHNRTAGINRIALVNDSCRIVRSLDGLFKWGQHREMWGVSKSFTHHPHIQSFFIVFQGQRAVDKLMDFVARNDVFQYKARSKDDIIKAFEVGLSKFMDEQGVDVEAPFTIQSLNTCPPVVSSAGMPNAYRRPTNPAFSMWDKMVACGCPIVKNARLRYSGDEAILRKYTDPRFSVGFAL